MQELKGQAPDFDERLTMNEIWKAGEGRLAHEALSVDSNPN